MNIEQLKPFCSTDESRIAINNPFHQNGYTFATDGRIIVRADGELPDCPRTVGNPPNIGPEYFRFPPTDAVRVATEKFPLDGPLALVCDKCRGVGLGRCGHCRSEIDCEACRGTGKVIPKETPIKIDDRLYNPVYLRLIFRLPGSSFTTWRSEVGGEIGPTGFVFDGGSGLLMPMRGESEE